MRYMFTMMNNARLSVGLEGLSLAERAFQMAVELRQGAQAGPRAGRAGGRAVSSIIDHPDVRRMLLTHARVDRGAARASSTPTRPRSTGPPATPTRPRAPAAHELADLLTPGVEGLGHRPRRGAHQPRPPGVRRHGLHRGDRRRPALPRRPHRPDLRGHQRHPGHGPGRPQAPDAGRRRGRRLPRLHRRDGRRSSARRATSWRRSAPRWPTAWRRCARPPTGCSPTAWPTRSTRWPAPRRTCACSAWSPAAG